jgi:hypothetical protein
VFAASLLASLPAAAVPIEFGFTGFVTVVVDMPFGYGTPISGSYVFESTTPSPASDGIYEGAVLSVSFTVGTTPVTIAGAIESSIDVNTLTIVPYSVQVQCTTCAPEEISSFGLSLWRAGSPTGGGALPLTPPALDLFSGQLSARTRDGVLFGELTSMFLVPEPSTGTLVAIGFAAAALYRRYDSRSR